MIAIAINHDQHDNLPRLHLFRPINARARTFTHTPMRAPINRHLRFTMDQFPAHSLSYYTKFSFTTTKPLQNNRASRQPSPARGVLKMYAIKISHDLRRGDNNKFVCRYYFLLMPSYGVLLSCSGIGKDHTTCTRSKKNDRTKVPVGQRKIIG